VGGKSRGVGEKGELGGLGEEGGPLWREEERERLPPLPTSSAGGTGSCCSADNQCIVRMRHAPPGRPADPRRRYPICAAGAGVSHYPPVGLTQRPAAGRYLPRQRPASRGVRARVPVAVGHASRLHRWGWWGEPRGRAGKGARTADADASAEQRRTAEGTRRPAGSHQGRWARRARGCVRAKPEGQGASTGRRVCDGASAAATRWSGGEAGATSGAAADGESPAVLRGGRGGWCRAPGRCASSKLHQ